MWTHLLSWAVQGHQFEEGHFLFQGDGVPVHKVSSIKKWFSQFGVEELDWPAQSPDLKPIHHLWDELRAGPYYPTSVLDLTDTLVAEWEKIPAARFQMC